MNNINNKIKMLLKHNIRKILFLFIRLIKFFIKKKIILSFKVIVLFHILKILDIYLNICLNIRQANLEYFGIQSQK